MRPRVSETSEGSVYRVLDALAFAAERHRDQRRKGAEGTPAINHLIEVARLLAGVGGIRDPVVLCAAVLHDILEDTGTTPDELEERFGARVRRVVEEVTDQPAADREERRRSQVARALNLSREAQLVKIADKISNVASISRAPPVGWSVQRRLSYLDSSEQVVSGCRGTSAPLELAYDRALAEARAELYRLTE
jgi:GTP diphosphokinase / guanosine-3',5'-bis(diphosphate) 3'-diphosphatase